VPELNILTAIPIGAFAAAVWAVVAIRRVLRSAKFVHFSPKQRGFVWGVAVLAFVPALFAAFLCSMLLSNLTVRPGPWNHLALALTSVFGLGVIGAALTWAAARVAAALVSGARAAT
jgi:hypothetical protein